jgi:RNA polymerase-binding transcription factor DksA
MNKSRQQKHRRLLDELAASLQPRAQAIGEEALGPSGGQGATELSNAPMHLGDQGTEEYLHGVNAVLMENEQYLLAEIRAAIARIEAGTYGACERCAKDIAAERLQALPYVRFCVACAEAWDEAPPINLNVGRPQGPSDTLADEEAMEIKRRDEKDSLTDMISGTEGAEGPDARRPDTRRRADVDVHASGTPGGGASVGGLAGATKGDGSPDVHDLQAAMGSDTFETAEGQEESRLTPIADQTGRAVRGTPATKR